MTLGKASAERGKKRQEKHLQMIFYIKCCNGELGKEDTS